MGATLFAYNYGTTHKGLFELMNHNAPVVKTLKGIAHRRTDDKPCVQQEGLDSSTQTQTVQEQSGQVGRTTEATVQPHKRYFNRVHR